MDVILLVGTYTVRSFYFVLSVFPTCNYSSCYISNIINQLLSSTEVFEVFNQF